MIETNLVCFEAEAKMEDEVEKVSLLLFIIAELHISECIMYYRINPRIDMVDPGY